MSSSATRLRQGFAGVEVLGRRSFSEGGKRMIQYAVLPTVNCAGAEYWMPRFRGA